MLTSQNMKSLNSSISYLQNILSCDANRFHNKKYNFEQLIVLEEFRSDTSNFICREIEHFADTSILD